jgi:hypothetical protein
MQLEALPIVSLSISSLLLDNSPRQGGENDDHVRVLAESHEQLPPIVVHGPSMRVIDGIHRVRAAIRRGEKKIRAKMYHGTDDEAFVLGTQELPATPELPDVRLSREDPSAPGSPDGADVATILADLKRDPSLRSSGPGQSLLRILDKYRVEMAGSNKMVEMVPDHCASSVAKLAREYARVWTKIAAQLEERRVLPPRP